MSSTSDSRSCCPLVCCLVPAATLPHGGMAAQPMQMFVMAPVAAPFAPSEDGFASGFTSYNLPDSSDWAWSAEGSWMNQAPPQFPMETACPGNLLQVMPPQFQMNMATSQLEAGLEPSSRTLRRRRPQAASVQKPQMHTACEYEEDPQAQATSEADEALSREIADELLRDLTTDADTQWSVLARFQHLAFSNKISSRAAQLALQDASANHATLLASSLKGHVRRAAHSKHANYVVQKIVEVMPMARAGFIVEELLGVAHETACHRFGCRLLCRILEHLSPGDKATRELLEEVLVNIEGLCSHAFGSYVVRHILEFGLPDHKHRVAMALLPSVVSYAKHRLGSHVVEAALRSCSPQDQRTITEALIADQEMAALATSQYGRHVVRALLVTTGALKEEVEDSLWEVEKQLRQSRFGKGVLQLLYTGSA